MSYYSFVTLTTVGYGDVTPATPIVRTLAWLEALIGQLYLAIFVAGLVGYRVSSHDSPSRESSRVVRPSRLGDPCDLSES